MKIDDGTAYDDIFTAIFAFNYDSLTHHRKAWEWCWKHRENIPLNVAMSTLHSSSESFTNPRRHTIMMNRIPIMISSLNPCDNRKCIMILMRMYELMFMANCDNMLIDDAIMLIERICNMLNDGYPMEFIHEAIIIEKEAIKSHE